MDSLPADLKENHGAKIEHIFSSYADNHFDLPEFELAILKLIKDVPAAVEAFKELLPTTNLVPSLSNKERMVFIRETCTFNDRVRAALYDDTYCYMRWLNHLIDYNYGVQTFLEFRKNVEVEAGLAKIAEVWMWMDFDAKFAPSNDDKMRDNSTTDIEVSNQDSSPAGVPPSDTTNSEAAFKRRKIV